MDSKTGSLDIAVLLTEGITKAVLQGLDAKIIQVYVTTPLHWGIHVPYKSAITSVDQLENQTFAISREGSGSHLMTYVKANQEGWDMTDLKFNVVGDVYGGLWALENNEAQAFLWEKYTTHPYTEQKKCRYIDEVVTPWPCFRDCCTNGSYRKVQERVGNGLRNRKPTSTRVEEKRRYCRPNLLEIQFTTWSGRKLAARNGLEL